MYKPETDSPPGIRVIWCYPVQAEVRNHFRVRRQSGTTNNGTTALTGPLGGSVFLVSTLDAPWLVRGQIPGSCGGLCVTPISSDATPVESCLPRGSRRIAVRRLRQNARRGHRPNRRGESVLYWRFRGRPQRRDRSPKRISLCRPSI